MTTEPAWLVRARAELGVHETPGPVSTQRILDYREMSGVRLGGDDGLVPWCAIFVGAMLAEAGVQGSGNGMARGYLRWGQHCALVTGAIVVFNSSRGPTTGHVAFATGRKTATHIEVVGGNQGDAVTVALQPLARVLGYRWPVGVALPTGTPVTIASAAPAKPVSDV